MVMLCDSLIFFGLYGSGLGQSHGASKQQGVYLWPLPSVRHLLTSFTSTPNISSNAHTKNSKPLSPSPCPTMSTTGRRSRVRVRN